MVANFDENLAYAEGIAGTFLARRLMARHRDEIMNSARIGLWKAAKSFDPSRGTTQFQTWAYPRIRGEVIDYCRAEIGGWKPGSLHDVPAEDLGYVPDRSPRPEPRPRRRDEPTIIDRLFSVLTDRQREVIRLRYGLGCEALSQSEAARAIGISRKVVRTTEDAAMQEMRRFAAGMRRDRIGRFRPLKFAAKQDEAE